MKILSFLFLLVLNSNSFAMEKSKSYQIGKLTLKGLYMFKTPKGAQVAAGFMKIENPESKKDILVSVSNVSFAEYVEIHEMVKEDNIMKMRPLEQGLAIPGQSEIYLKPSGYHIMFIGLKEQITKQNKYQATLNFKNAGSVDVMFKVVNRGYHPDKNHHKYH